MGMEHVDLAWKMGVEHGLTKNRWALTKHHWGSKLPPFNSDMGHVNEVYLMKRP